jgi:lipopolysaccharide heptosyltransferase I
MDQRGDQLLERPPRAPYTFRTGHRCPCTPADFRDDREEQQLKAHSDLSRDNGRKFPDLNPAALRSLLIIKMSSIGDVVQALPVAVALRAKYPALRICWLIEEWAAPLLLGHPSIDRLIIFPRMSSIRSGVIRVKELRRSVASLRSESYDLVIDLQGLMKSSILALLSRAPLRIGGDLLREGAGLISHRIPAGPGQPHAVETYLRCAEFLGASARPVRFELAVQGSARDSIAALLSSRGVSPGSPLIVLNPSASARWKSWPLQAWIAAADALTDLGSVLLVGGSENSAAHRKIATAVQGRIHDLTGQTTLAELVALLERCAAHVAPDTGSAHIAAALGRPVVGIYGPTAPWRLAPYGQQNLLVYHQGMCGRSCPGLCVRGRRCLSSIRPGEVVARVKDALASSSDAAEFR